MSNNESTDKLTFKEEIVFSQKAYLSIANRAVELGLTRDQYLERCHWQSVDRKTIDYFHNELLSNAETIIADLKRKLTEGHPIPGGR